MAKNIKRNVSFTTSGTETLKRPAARPGSEFNPDYTYVKKDLILMAYQALFFIGVLIVLAFILH
jgi:hypothetical protein